MQKLLSSIDLAHVQTIYCSTDIEQGYFYPEKSRLMSVLFFYCPIIGAWCVKNYKGRHSITMTAAGVSVVFIRVRTLGMTYYWYSGRTQ